MRNRYSDPTDALSQWGLWRRKLIDAAALSGETVISRSMAGKLHSGATERRANRMTATDYCIDIDRRVAALPEKLQQVVIAEYVAGGSVREKTVAAGLPVTTYYRHLARAISLMG